MADSRDPRLVVREIVDDPPIRMTQSLLIGWLTVAAGMTLCTLAASSACMARLDLPDDELATMTLAMGGGVGVGQADATQHWMQSPSDRPLALQGDILRRLRNETWTDSNGVPYQLRWVHVHQFRWRLWRGKWWFIVGLAVLAWGGVLVHRGSLAEPESLPDSADLTAQEELLSAFRALERALEDLRTEVDRKPDRAQQCAAMLRWLDQIEFREAAVFVRLCQEAAARGEANAEQLLEGFAVSERYLQRAYSTAADLDVPESMDSVEIAVRNLLDLEQWVSS